MQGDLGFPQSLAEKYRPRTIAEFIGLEKPKEILTKFAAKPYPSAWLFVGPPGVGKTSMALALASQIGAELHHLPSGKCNAQSIEETIRLCHYMPMTLGGSHLVLVDEADGMTNPAQLALLSKLDATAFPPNTVFIFTCNGTVGLEPRFLSRCRTVEFSSYGMASDIAALMGRVWHSEGGNGNSLDFSRLAKDCRNNVRDALMNLEVELMAL
jgi:replication-associated recombination protein RarA